MEAKIKKLLDRLVEIENLMGQGDTIFDKDLFKKLSQEHSYLTQIKDAWDYLSKLNKELIENKNLLISEKDPELVEVIKEEIAHLDREIVLTDKRLKNLIVPPDPNDDRNIILEIRAGTGEKKLRFLWPIA